MLKSMCFSGHRLKKILELISPSDILNNTDVSKARNDFLEIVKSIIYVKVNNYIDNGFRKFYIGMSNGIDIWVGEMLLDLKLSQYTDIEIVAVIPFPKHGSNFSAKDKVLYNKILEQASQVVYMDYRDTSWSYLERNRYMVDNSTHLLAFIYDYNSGTGYTVKYAKSLNKSVETINLLTLSEGFIKAYNNNQYFYSMMDYM